MGQLRMTSLMTYQPDSTAYENEKNKMCMIFFCQKLYEPVLVWVLRQLHEKVSPVSEIGTD